MKQNFKKYLPIIGLILFVYVLTRVKWVDLLEVLEKTDPVFLIFAVFLIIPSLLAKTFKWMEIIKILNIEVSFKRLFLIFNQGWFLGIITPGKLGEFYRVRALSSSLNIPTEKSFFSVAFDKMIDFLGSVLIGLIAILALIYIFGASISPIAVVFFVFITSITIFFLIERNISDRILRLVFEFIAPDWIKKKIQTLFNNFLIEMSKLSKITIVKLFLYELLGDFFVILAYFFLASSIGLEIPFWYLFLIAPLISLIIALPISLLGVGTREASYIFLLSFVNIGLSEAVAFSLLVLFWNILSGIPGLSINTYQKVFKKHEK